MTFSPIRYDKTNDDKYYNSTPSKVRYGHQKSNFLRSNISNHHHDHTRNYRELNYQRNEGSYKHDSWGYPISLLDYNNMPRDRDYNRSTSWAMTMPLPPPPPPSDPFYNYSMMNPDQKIIDTAAQKRSLAGITEEVHRRIVRRKIKNMPLSEVKKKKKESSVTDENVVQVLLQNEHEGGESPAHMRSPAQLFQTMLRQPMPQNFARTDPPALVTPPRRLSRRLVNKPLDTSPNSFTTSNSIASRGWQGFRPAVSKYVYTAPAPVAASPPGPITILDLLAYRDIPVEKPYSMRGFSAQSSQERRSELTWSHEKPPRTKLKDQRRDRLDRYSARNSPHDKEGLSPVSSLHRATNAFRPSLGPESPVKKDSNLELRKSVNSILNKLCPEKFDTLSDKLASLEIRDHHHLQLVTDLVFAKAVSEHSYCEMYSDMCMKLRDHYPKFPSEEEGAPPHSITRSLLNRCQEEFDNLPSSFDDIVGTDNLDPSEKEHRIHKYKERVLGNMKFIGQLFSRRLLSNKVIREVVISLIFKDDLPLEHHIECSCMLLRNIGACLESTKNGKDNCNHFILRLQHLLTQQNYSKRIKFAMEDIIELHAKNWQERVMTESKAKTKDEIRIDRIKEERRKTCGVLNPFAVTEIAGQRPSYI